MPRVGLNQDAVIKRAAQLIDERGTDELSLAAVADSYGVRVPSLYKHISGMPAIKRGIMLLAKNDLCSALGQAAIGKSRDDAIASVAIAYRAWALAHPGQYPLAMRAPVPGDDEDFIASMAILNVIVTILAGYGLLADDAIDATRYLRAVLHGFVALETGDAFQMPFDLERSYSRLVECVIAALATWTRSE